MKFVTDNYRLKLTQDFPFIKHIETNNPIYSLKKTHTALLYTKSIEINIQNKKTKQMHFDNNTCCIEANDNMIIAGDENGQVKVFDYKKRNINTVECNFRINGIKMLNNSFLVIGNALDVCLYEYFNKDCKVLYIHNDYITCCDNKNDLLVTGSIDKTVIIYDLKLQKKLSTIVFDSPVSKIEFKDDKYIVVVAKYQMYLVQIDTQKIINSCYIHTKETTGLVLHKDRIYTSSLDGNIKSWTHDFKQISQVKFEDKILSFDICDEIIYVGLSNGAIYKLDKDQPSFEKATKVISNQQRRYYQDEGDTNIKRIKIAKRKQSEIEKLINNNQHWLAFSKIFCEPDIDVIYAVLHFIKELRGLKRMMIDRSEEELTGLFDFIIDNFRYAEMRGIFVELMIICTSLYEDEILENEELIEKLHYLNDLLLEECKFQSKAIELTGYIECVLIEK